MIIAGAVVHELLSCLCGAAMDPVERCDCLPRWEAPVFWGEKDKRGRNGKETDKKAAGKAVIH